MMIEPIRIHSSGSSDLVFFFSSRRRHTRFDCDWSSDVCSSDLTENGAEGLTDTLICVDDPASIAARYGRYVGRAPMRRAGMYVIALDRGGLVLDRKSVV